MEPTEASVFHFIEFLRGISTNKGDIGYVVSNKHRQSFYPILNNNLHRYTTFLKQLTKGFDRHLQELWNTRQDVTHDDTRAAAVDKTKKFLAWCAYSDTNIPPSLYDKDGKGLPFLSHACLADWEELFYEPVGKVTFESVKMGPGGQSAIELVAHTMGVTTKEAADEILRVIKEILPNKWLTVLGFKKINGTVYSTKHNREVGYSDIDQTCCKFYLLVMSTHPTRTISETPNADKPHCEPVRMHENDSDFECSACILSPTAHEGMKDSNEELLDTCVNKDGTENRNSTQHFCYTYKTTKDDTQEEKKQTFYYHVVPKIPMMPGEDEYLNGKTRRRVAEEYLNAWKHDTAEVGCIRTLTIPPPLLSKRKSGERRVEPEDDGTPPPKHRRMTRSAHKAKTIPQPITHANKAPK